MIEFVPANPRKRPGMEYIMMIRYLAICCVSMLLVGCTNYNYIVTDSKHLSQRVSKDTQTTLKIDPVIYGMVVKENRLVLTIKNTLADPVELLGTKSTVVDEKGQSHPLRSQTIAPNAFVKLILPPLRPRFETAPSGGFMFGMHARRESSAVPDAAEPKSLRAPVATHSAEPIYLDYFSDTDPYYWDFDGESEIRLLLTYQKADGTVWTDQFVIQRQKA